MTFGGNKGTQVRGGGGRDLCYQGFFLVSLDFFSFFIQIKPYKAGAIESKGLQVTSATGTLPLNKCDQLPAMAGKPLKIHINSKAIPYYAYTAIPIPYYWEDQVKDLLDEDVELGIMQEAPQGESTD